jgi:hypothetical protein
VTPTSLPIPLHRGHRCVEEHCMTINPVGAPSSTDRSRRHRQRRRRGTRCITVDVSELEVSALVVKGYLSEEARNEVKAIKGAIEGLISSRRRVSHKLAPHSIQRAAVVASLSRATPTVGGIR